MKLFSFLLLAAAATATPILLCATNQKLPSHIGLLNEASRLLSRANKKINKANQKVENCRQDKDRLMAMQKPPLRELEALLDIQALEADLQAQINRRDQLLALVEGLREGPWEDTAERLTPSAMQLVVLSEYLGVNDHPPVRPPSRLRKPKGPRPATIQRLPYKIFRGTDGVEIRVGRSANDNDELSTNPKYRDSDDWWLHAASVPGSHVIIRSCSLPSADHLPQEVRQIQ